MRQILTRRGLLYASVVSGVGALAYLTNGIARRDGLIDEQTPNEVLIWKFTGTAECRNGQRWEYWCQYECIGQTCTMLQCEWRPTGQPCG